MSKNNENKLVPKLRFPEFKNETWKIKTIDELCEVLNNLRKPLTSNLREKGRYPYYGASGVIDSVKDFIFNERLLLIGEDGAKWGGYDRTAFIAEGKYWVNNHAHVLKPTGVVDTLLENYLFKLDMSPFITGAAPPKLTLGKLKSIPVPIPNNRSEQQKIAACLSSLDALISAERQKLEALKAHKKGLLQQLFPQEGERTPRFRFKEFERDGDWVERRLGEVAEIGRGKSKHRPRDAEFLFGGQYPFIQTGDIKKAGLYLTEFSQTYSEEGLKQSKLWDENTLCITIAANIAESSILKIKACFPDSVIGLLTDENKTKVLFVKYLFDAYKEQIQSHSQGVAQENLNQEKLSQITFRFPSIEEQQKIAATLSSVDDLVSAQQQKTEALQMHKKGLLQGLFPTLNEETV